MWMRMCSLSLCVWFRLDYNRSLAILFFVLSRLMLIWMVHTQIYAEYLMKTKMWISRRKKSATTTAAAIKVRLITYYSRLDNLKVVQLFFALSQSVSALLFFLWLVLFCVCATDIGKVHVCRYVHVHVYVSFDSRYKSDDTARSEGKKERTNERREERQQAKFEMRSRFAKLVVANISRKIAHQHMWGAEYSWNFKRRFFSTYNKRNHVVNSFASLW